MPPAFPEELLGFDARVSSPSQLECLRNYSSEHYTLLKSDVRFVCSTDVLVWPSIFDNDSPVESPTSPAEGPRLPHWIGPNFPLWAVLREMEDHINTIRAPVAFWKIAVTEVLQVSPSNQRKAGSAWPAFNTTQPSTIQEGWVFLGYDVADRSLLSGLSNCGYTASQVTQFREAFGRYLNDYHLFESLDMALQFKEVSDVRVKEHAPFYVYGLWRIP